MVRVRCWYFALVLFAWTGAVTSHGRLREPPGRSSMFRAGFNTPPNYNDNQLNCGGFYTQWTVNGGKCGICGDPYNGERENEAFGKYANNIITRTYNESSQIDVTVEITANHKGYFEFRLCENDEKDFPVTQGCLDMHVLTMAGTDDTKFVIGTQNRNYTFTLQLPEGVVCSRCILQWKYNAGNSEGIDFVTGNACVGCGKQEQFYACSDIAILRTNIGYAVSQEEPSTTVNVTPLVPDHTLLQLLERSTYNSTTLPSAHTANKTCKSFVFDDQVSHDWCTQNCNHNPPFCPRSFCMCFDGESVIQRPKQCKSVVLDDSRYHLWCVINCNHDPSFCPPLFCTCLDEDNDEYTPPPMKACRSIVSDTNTYHSWCEATCNHNPPVCPELFCVCEDDDNWDVWNIDRKTCRSRQNDWTKDAWCMTNCNHNPAFCPESECICSDDEQWDASDNTMKECRSTRNTAAADSWCTSNCNHVPPYCPGDECYCSNNRSDSLQDQIEEVTESSVNLQDQIEEVTESSVLPCVSLVSHIRDEWCNDNCNHIPSFCPVDTCVCLEAGQSETTTNDPSETTTNDPSETTTNDPSETTTNDPSETTTNDSSDKTTNDPSETTTNDSSETTTNDSSETTTNDQSETTTYDQK